MNVSVIFFIACLIHFDILLGNSLDLASHDEEGDVDLPEALGDDFDMSYLKCTSEGCELVKGSINELAKPGPWEVENEEAQSPHSRSKRKMFLPDNRLRLREQSVGRFPFNSAVAIRVNGEVKCSGVALLRPRFFLTAAHCVQPDGKRKDIEVGVLHKFRVMQWAKVENTRVHPIWKSRK
ncbi:serine protease 23-like, partial [Paramuricea clavata]